MHFFRKLDNCFTKVEFQRQKRETKEALELKVYAKPFLRT